MTAIMSNTTLDTASLVQQLNDEKVKTLIPAIVYIALLMVTGLIGNIMVFFFYAFKTKTVPTSIFIVTLAIYDLIFCSVSMPVEIVDNVRFYTFENGAACKILRFINYTAATASGLTLVTIAIDRFRHIRRATEKQMTVQNAKRYCLLVAGGTLLMTWPIFFIYNAEEVPVPNQLGLELIGHDCTFIKSDAYKPYVLAYNSVVIISFVVCASILTVLYSKVAYVIYTHKKALVKHQLNIPKLPSSSTNTPHSEYGEESQVDGKNTASTDLDSSPRLENASDEISKEMHASKKPDAKVGKSTDAGSHETIRLTLLMLAVTSVFVLSYVPYLCLIIWRGLAGIHEGELSDAGLVGFKIGSRSYLLNSSLNPWIYGFFNRRFRQYYHRLFFRT